MALPPLVVRVVSDTSGLSQGMRMARMAILGIAAVAGKMAYDFEKSFQRINAVTNTSQKQMAAWRKDIVKLSGVTARAPTELADALYFLASAGLDASQIMPTLEMSAKAAASGLGETADIARLTANAMNAYSKQGLTAAQVTDTLVAAVREGTAEPEEFANALGRILPIASKAGVSFDQVAASLAGLSNVGLKVNEGVTAMRSLLQGLVAPGSQAAEALKEVGISADQMREVISEQGILGAMRLLEEATGGNIDQMRKIIPNIRALTGQFGLTAQNARKVDEIFRQIAGSSGAMDEAFRKTTQGPAFQMEKAINDIKLSLLDLGQTLLPIAQKIVNAVSKMATAFSELPEPVQNATVAMGGLVLLAGPLGRLGKVAKGLGAALLGLGAAAGGGGGAAAGAGAAKGAGAAAGLSALKGPLLAVAAFAVALGAGVKKATEENHKLADASLLLGIHARQAQLGMRPMSEVLANVNTMLQRGQLNMSSFRQGLAMGATGARLLAHGLTAAQMASIRAFIAAGDYRGALEALKGAAEANQRAADRNTDSINRTGEAASDSAQKARGMAGALNAIPKEVRSRIALDTGQFDSALAGANARLAAFSGRTVTAYANIIVSERRRAHEGGFIGPSFHRGGEVPALLKVGEFVMSPRATQHWGVGMLAAMNRMHSGGPVATPPRMGGRSSGGGPKRVVITDWRKGVGYIVDEAVDEATDPDVLAPAVARILSGGGV